MNKGLEILKERIEENRKRMDYLREEVKELNSEIGVLRSENEAIKKLLDSQSEEFINDVPDTVEIVYRNRYDCMPVRLVAA